MSTDKKLLYKCTPRQARKFIIECLDAGLVPFLQGSPGIGKSSIVRSIAQDFLLWLIDHRVSTSEPTDATGLPKFDADGFAHYAPFKDIFPLAGVSQLPKNLKGQLMRGWLIFLDEFNAAPNKVQVAFYKFILDRMIGQHHLHDNTAIVMAGNLMTDRAIVNRLSTAMQSRVVHLELEVSFKEWLEDVAFAHNYDPRIIGFLSQYESKLMDFKPEHHDKTFCCPRTWEFVNRLLLGKECDEKGNIVRTFPKEINEETGILLGGTITSGVAAEFVQFTKVWTHMISVKEIEANPLTCRLPTELNLKWAMVIHMMEKITDKNFDALATYADRFDLAFRILFYRFILIRKKDLRYHNDFGKHSSAVMKYLDGTATTPSP